jgi:hypothetical protein
MDRHKNGSAQKHGKWIGTKTRMRPCRCRLATRRRRLDRDEMGGLEEDEEVVVEEEEEVVVEVEEEVEEEEVVGVGSLPAWQGNISML